MEEKNSEILEELISKTDYDVGLSIVESLLKAIPYLEAKNSDHTFVADFIEELIEAVAQDRDGSIQEEVDEKISFQWMSYYFLHYLGYRLFLRNIELIKKRDSTTSVEEIAALIVDIVNEVSENADYLVDSEDPVQIAQNLIWRILNSPRLIERFGGLDENELIVTDILDDLLDVLPIEGEDETLDEDETLKTISLEDYNKVEIFDLIPEECKEFSGINRIADEFTKNILFKAKSKVENFENVLAIDFTNGFEKLLPSEFQCKFPEIKDFNITTGKNAIIKFLTCWYFQEDWSYSVEFLMSQSDACSDFHFYEVKWSLPTRMYPVPQATASVFFKIEVSRVIPLTCPVNITYNYECDSYEQTPFQNSFSEEHLIKILEGKLQLYKQIRF